MGTKLQNRIQQKAKEWIVSSGVSFLLAHNKDEPRERIMELQESSKK
jgi:hypothetical protein